MVGVAVSVWLDSSWLSGVVVESKPDAGEFRVDFDDEAEGEAWVSASQQWQRLGPAVEVPEPTPTEPVLSQRKPPPAEKEPQSARRRNTLNYEVAADDVDQLGRVVLQYPTKRNHRLIGHMSKSASQHARATIERLYNACVVTCRDRTLQIWNKPHDSIDPSTQEASTQAKTQASKQAGTRRQHLCRRREPYHLAGLLRAGRD